MGRNRKKQSKEGKLTIEDQKKTTERRGTEKSGD